jgi:hypothetical protein
MQTEELHNLYPSPNVIMVIKPRRLDISWFDEKLLLGLNIHFIL